MKDMSTKELQIAERARKHKQAALTNLQEFIDDDFLQSSFKSLNMLLPTKSIPLSPHYSG